MSTPLLLIVGANKGGVGKSTVARLILDYSNAKNSAYRVFDADPPHGSLKRFYPQAKIVNLTDTRDLAEVLDGVKAMPVTVVDVRAALLSRTLGMMGDLGMLTDVAAGKQRLAVMHVLGPSADSLREAADVAALLAEGGQHFLYKNAVNDEHFEWTEGTHKWAFDHIDPAGVVNIPHLDGVAREAVDAHAMSFLAFVNDETKSMLLRRLVNKWYDDCVKEFEKIGLRGVLRG